MKAIVISNQNTSTSLCCKASVIGLRECSKAENEAQSINVCSACNSEAPKAYMFKMGEVEINQFFMDLYNNTSLRVIERQKLTPSLKKKPYYIKTNNKTT